MLASLLGLASAGRHPVTGVRLKIESLPTREAQHLRSIRIAVWEALAQAEAQTVFRLGGKGEVDGGKGGQSHPVREGEAIGAINVPP